MTEHDFDQLICDVSNCSSPYFLAGVRSQLKPLAWLYMLSAGDDYDWDTHFILDGILYGFHVVNIDADIPMYCQKNYRSCFADDHHEKLSKIISSEVAGGKLSRVSEESHCVHALGVVKKKDTGKIRPITDCKRPLHISVNNFTDKVWEHFSFVSIETVVKSIVEGKFYISTVDLANAYRSILISPLDRKFFGLEFDGVRYQDNFLCFGCRAAPFIFNRITDSVARYMRSKNIVCYNYLDDLVCVSETFEKGVSDQLFLIDHLRRLGFYISWEKVQSPSRVCKYLGIEIDTINMELRLPEERLIKLRKELLFWRGKKKATHKQLQTLVGHLSHCSRIVQGGKLYMFFLIEFLIQSKGKRRVKLSADFHNDLSWWWVFVENFNRVPICNLDVSTDWVTFLDAGDCVCVASRSMEHLVGVEGVAENMVSYTAQDGQFTVYLPNELVTDSAAREIVCLWLYLMENRQIHDKTISVVVFHSRTYLCLKKSRHKNAMVSMVLRHIFWWSLQNNVKLEFRYDSIFY